MVDTISNLSGPVGIAIANVPPCPTPSDRMCIETTRIFDSCMFEEQQEKIFKLPNSIEDDDIQCKIIKTNCKILDVTKINEQNDLADVKLQIKVFVRFTSKCFNDYGFKGLFYFDKNVTLVVPEGADVCCDINNAACVYIQSCNKSCNSKYFDRVRCTVKVTEVVKSKKLVQIEVPFLRSCESKQCSSYEGIPVAPGKSLTLPNKPYELSMIKFAARTNPGMTSRFTAFLNVIPYTFTTVTGELKPFEINLPGGPYPVENISL